jgi:hypothetical protein
MLTNAWICDSASSGARLTLYACLSRIPSSYIEMFFVKQNSYCIRYIEGDSCGKEIKIKILHMIKWKTVLDKKIKEG